MTKELFIRKMTAILDYMEEQGALNDMLDKITDGGAIVTIGDNIVSELLASINESMAIDDTNLLSWWLWEGVDKVIYWGEREIKVETLEELYDYILMD